MLAIAPDQLATVCGGENLFQVIHALRSTPQVPLADQYATTKQFIADHPFFHRGLMNLPIGGGRHFRNKAFVGPWTSFKGHLRGDDEQIARGHEITRATHDAP